ncbi:MAG: preprotein translocase subunit YajC [Oligoflexales bacterium]
MWSKLLAFDVALAQDAAKAAQPSIFEMLLMPLGFILIMYFLIIRPQQKKHKEHQSLLTQLKIGDEIVTSGGIIGRIKSVADAFVTVEVANNMAIKVLKGHINSLAKEAAKPAK